MKILLAQGLLDSIKEAQQFIAPKIPIEGNIADLLTKGGFNLINFIFFIIGLVFFVNLILAAWEYLLSSGDPKRAASANQRILNAIIGILLVFASFIIIRVVTAILGLGDLI
ncbi:hypothetical protein HYS10_00145 [Candidatus Collierbacteria bacterium]|nr:hypothetical protein [Candidatus Collierbacteria bacterium]